MPLSVHENPLCGGRADRPLAPAGRTGPARHAPHGKQAVHEERGCGNGGEAGQGLTSVQMKNRVIKKH